MKKSSKIKIKSELNSKNDKSVKIEDLMCGKTLSEKVSLLIRI